MMASWTRFADRGNWSGPSSRVPMAPWTPKHSRAFLNLGARSGSLPRQRATMNGDHSGWLRSRPPAQRVSSSGWATMTATRLLPFSCHACSPCLFMWSPTILKVVSGWMGRLIPGQSLYGIELRGFPGGQVAEDDAREEGAAKGDEDRGDGEDHPPAGDGGSGPAAEEAQEHPGEASDEADHH